MHTRAPSASLLADRGAAFTFVILLHLAVGYAFVSGLTTTFVKFVGEPFVVRPIAEPQRAEVIPPPLPVREMPIPVPQPALPGAVPASDEGLSTQKMPSNVDPVGGTQVIPAAPILTPVRMDPRHPLKIGPDNYPDSAVRLGQEGRCVVNLGVAADGRIMEFSLQTSTGVDVLDAACLKAVRGQRMLPALQDGNPVSSRASIPIVWKLESR